MKDIKGTLQWLLKDPSFGTSTIGFINSLPLTADGPGKAVEPLACLRQSLPGDLTADVPARPGDLFAAIRGFFQDSVPAVVEERAEALELSATAFLDFAATDVKVFVHAGVGPGAGSVLVFRHASPRDVVRFHQLWSAAVKHLRAKHFLVESGGPDSHPSCGFGGGGGLEDDDFLDDFLDEDEQDWGARVESALEAAASADASAREQGLQALAGWAKSRPDARPAIGRALSARPQLVDGLLRAPTIELYPFVTVLKCATLQDCAAFAGLQEKIEAMLSSGLPPIVRRELREIRAGLARQFEAPSRLPGGA